MCCGIVVVVVNDYICGCIGYINIYYYTAKNYILKIYTIYAVGGPFVSEGYHIFLKYLDLGIQIFRNIWTGGNKNRGSKFVVTDQLAPTITPLLEH